MREGEESRVTLGSQFEQLNGRRCHFPEIEKAEGKGWESEKNWESCFGHVTFDYLLDIHPSRAIK